MAEPVRQHKLSEYSMFFAVPISGISDFEEAAESMFLAANDLDGTRWS